ncbi:MAG: hypothetical protein ACO3N7_10805 [Kiritimatiellia bacterium]
MKQTVLQFGGGQLARLLGVPFVFTGHSLGRVKEMRLLESGVPKEKIESRYNISSRIEAEEFALETCSLICTSTHQEVKEQSELYENYIPERMEVIPPGVDLEAFHPPKEGDPVPAIATRKTALLKQTLRHRPTMDWSLTRNKKSQDPYRRKLNENIRRILSQRNHSEALRGNHMKLIPEFENPHVLGYLRWHDANRLIVLANFSEQTLTLPMRHLRAHGFSHFMADLFTGKVLSTQEDLNLVPYGILWLQED